MHSHMNVIFFLTFYAFMVLSCVIILRKMYVSQLEFAPNIVKPI